VQTEAWKIFKKTWNVKKIERIEGIVIPTAQQRRTVTVYRNLAYSIGDIDTQCCGAVSYIQIDSNLLWMFLYIAMR